MKKAILIFGLFITALTFTSYVEPTKEDVKIDKTSSTSDIKGQQSAGSGA